MYDDTTDDPMPYATIQLYLLDQTCNMRHWLVKPFMIYADFVTFSAMGFFAKFAIGSKFLKFKNKHKIVLFY